MLNKSGLYRVFKGVIDFIDRDTNMIMSTDTLFDLGDVGSFESYPYDSLKSKGEHVTVYFTNNKMPITLRCKYKDFCNIHEKYLLDTGALDNRTQKKTLNYSGYMKPDFLSNSQYFVTTFYPKGFTFRDKSEFDILDSILLNEIRPLS